MTGWRCLQETITTSCCFVRDTWWLVQTLDICNYGTSALCVKSHALHTNRCHAPVVLTASHCLSHKQQMLFLDQAIGSTCWHHALCMPDLVMRVLFVAACTGSPSAPPFSSFACSITRVGSTCRGQCSRGFSATPAITATCLAGGVWDMPKGRCLPLGESDLG